MNIEYYGNSFIKGNSPTLFQLGDPFSRQREYELESRLKYSSEHDPDRPPRWAPGDKYTVTGMIVGLIVGGVLGAIGGGRDLRYTLFRGARQGPRMLGRVHRDEVQPRYH